MIVIVPEWSMYYASSSLGVFIHVNKHKFSKDRLEEPNTLMMIKWNQNRSKNENNKTRQEKHTYKRRCWYVCVSYSVCFEVFFAMYSTLNVFDCILSSLVYSAYLMNWSWFFTPVSRVKQFIAKIILRFLFTYKINK